MAQLPDKEKEKSAKELGFPRLPNLKDMIVLTDIMQDGDWHKKIDKDTSSQTEIDQILIAFERDGVSDKEFYDQFDKKDFESNFNLIRKMRKNADIKIPNFEKIYMLCENTDRFVNCFGWALNDRKEIHIPDIEDIKDQLKIYYNDYETEIIENPKENNNYINDNEELKWLVYYTKQSDNSDHASHIAIKMDYEDFQLRNDSNNWEFIFNTLDMSRLENKVFNKNIYVWCSVAGTYSPLFIHAKEFYDVRDDHSYLKYGILAKPKEKNGKKSKK